MLEYRPRDNDGWRIPRPGTKSSAIYHLAKRGMPNQEIAKMLEMTKRSVTVNLWRIRNPGPSNAMAYSYRNNRTRKMECVSL